MLPSLSHFDSQIRSNGDRHNVPCSVASSSTINQTFFAAIYISITSTPCNPNLPVLQMHNTPTLTRTSSTMKVTGNIDTDEGHAADFCYRSKSGMAASVESSMAAFTFIHLTCGSAFFVTIFYSIVINLLTM